MTEVVATMRQLRVEEFHWEGLKIKLGPEALPPPPQREPKEEDPAAHQKRYLKALLASSSMRPKL